MNRREFLRGFVVSTVLVGISIVGIDQMFKLAEQQQQAAPPQQQLQSQTTTSGTQSGGVSSVSSAQSATTTVSGPSTPPGYVFVAAASALNGKSYAYFNHPNFGSSILVYYNGAWKAFSAICTHRVCDLQYQGSAIYCPCHGGTFSPSNGAVTGGPPPSAIAEYAVQIIGGNLYVGTSRIN
jgi:Rieske Fe-S protein